MGFLCRIFRREKTPVLTEGSRPVGLIEKPADLVESKNIEQDLSSGTTGKEIEMAILKKDEAPVPVREAASNMNALLGKGSEFEGKLTFEGTVRIDGRFSGEIFSEETLVVGEGAKIKAEVSVGSLVLYGEIIGNVKALQHAELHAPARLIGNLTTPSLMVESGVILEGTCKMENLGGGKISIPKSEFSSDSSN